jgi:hypothetical protein
LKKPSIVGILNSGAVLSPPMLFNIVEVFIMSFTPLKLAFLKATRPELEGVALDAAVDAVSDADVVAFALGHIDNAAYQRLIHFRDNGGTLTEEQLAIIAQAETVDERTNAANWFRRFYEDEGIPETEIDEWYATVCDLYHQPEFADQPIENAYEAARVIHCE